MYSVEAQVLKVLDPSTLEISVEWEEVATIPQLPFEIDELREARSLARDARFHYASVRIVKWMIGGARFIVD